MSTYKREPLGSRIRHTLVITRDDMAAGNNLQGFNLDSSTGTRTTLQADGVGGTLIYLGASLTDFVGSGGVAFPLIGEDGTYTFATDPFVATAPTSIAVEDEGPLRSISFAVWTLPDGIDHATLTVLQ
jgi:hypothetical protein